MCILGGSWWWLTCLHLLNLNGCMVKGQVAGSPLAGLLLTQQVQGTEESCLSGRLKSPNSKADHGKVHIPLQPVPISLPTPPTPLWDNWPHILTRSSFHSIWLPPHMVAEPEPPQASLISIAWILLWYNDLGQFVLLLPGHLIGSLQSPCACMLTPSHSQSASPQQGGDHLWLYQVSRLRGMAGTQVWSLVVQGPDSPVSWGCCCFHVPAGVPGSGASNNLLQMSYNLQSVGWFLGICGVSLLLFFIILRTFSCWIS